METMIVVSSNPVDPSREEEMNNWYSWVHIRDVTLLKGTVAVQRFVLDDIQPAGASFDHKYLSVYEIDDKEACTKGHHEKMCTWEMEISSAFDVPSHREAYWDPCYGTADFAEYADSKGDRSVLVSRVIAAGAATVEELLSKEVLKEMSELPGFLAVHLLEYGTDQQMTAHPDPKSHVLIAQLHNSALAAASWDAFMAERGALIQGLETETALYTPVIDRLRAGDRVKSAEWRAITFLSHAILGPINGKYGPEILEPYKAAAAEKAE